VSMKPSGVITTELPPPSSSRPPRTRRATRRLPTEGVSRSATSITAREYASSASASSKSVSGIEPGCSDPRIASMSISDISAKLPAGLGAPSICESPFVAEVETSRDGAVLAITLNRPDVLNAFNAAMHKALGAALKEACDPAVRAVVITGRGRGFCVGQDLTEFREAPGDIGGRLRGNYHPNVIAIRALEKPVIAAVNGAAAGAGLSFACACDLRIAADSAAFVPAFINIGLVPDSGSTFFVARLLGPARAFEWMSSGRRLTAAEAHGWGLVSEVVEAAALPARAAELAAGLAALPT